MSAKPAIDYLERIDFKKGDFLFKEGDKTQCFYIIQEGEFEVFLKDSKGEEIKLAKLGVGQPIGEFAMVGNKPRCANARALSNGSVTRISAEGYKHLLDELPHWAVRIMESLIERLRTTDELLRRSSEAKEITKDTFEEIRKAAAR